MYGWDVSLDRWWNDSDRENEVPGEMSQCHFVHNRSHVNWPAIKSAPQWKAEHEERGYVSGFMRKLSDNQNYAVLKPLKAVRWIVGMTTLEDAPLYLLFDSLQHPVVCHQTQNARCYPKLAVPAFLWTGRPDTANAYTKYVGDGSIRVRAGEEGTYTGLIAESVATQTYCH